MTFEVVQVVGDALGFFYGDRFFFEVITPMLRRLDRVDQDVPLTAAVHAAASARSPEALEDHG